MTRLGGGSCIVLHYCASVYRVVLSYVEGKVSLGESAETTWTTLETRATINDSSPNNEM